MEDLKKIAGNFQINETVTEIKPLGKGLINDTFLVKTAGGGKDYVLQRINNSVFKDVELLQSNIDAVTDHIRGKLISKGESDIDRKVLRFIKAGDKSYCVEEGKYWRLSVFIPDTVTKSEVNPESSYDTGLAFGNFEAMLEDIDATIGESIPDFHNMELRSRQLKEAISNDSAGRLANPEIKQIISFLNDYDDEMCKAERMFREGLLPKRICHCDPKVDNILFDKDGKILCVIDLDTVMPSFIFSDFGDFLRTGANTVAEDSPEISQVEFRMDIYNAFREGYLESARFLTSIEKENLPYAARLFPYMQAVRFFADYLNGDTYYKITYPEHNLVRTRNQIALFKNATAKLKEK